MSLIKKYWKSTLLIIILFVLNIVDLSKMKDNISLPEFYINTDKIQHCIAYLVLTLILAYEIKSREVYAFVILKAALISFFIGIILEYSQNFISYREFNIYDIIANTIGILLSVVLYKLFTRIQKTR